MEVDPGTTVKQFFDQQVRTGKAINYLIRVNRQPVATDQVLQDGDRISVTPTKIGVFRVPWPVRRLRIVYLQRLPDRVRRLQPALLRGVLPRWLLRILPKSSGRGGGSGDGRRCCIRAADR